MPSFVASALKLPMFWPAKSQTPVEASDVDSTPPLPDAARFIGVCEDYLAYLPSRHRNLSVPDDIKFFRRYVMNTEFNSWTDKPMSKVTDQDIEAYVEGFVKRGNPILARNCLVKVRAMLSWAMAPDRRRRYGLESDPALHLTPRLLGINVRHRTTILSRAELQAYLLACERMPNVSDEVLGKSLVFNPGRLNELDSMRWPDVDLEHGLWAVSSTNGIDRVQPLSSAAAALLEELRSIEPPAIDDFVFGKGAGNKGPRNRNRMKRMIDLRMQQILHDAGLGFREWKWQDLRRTVRVMLSELGVAKIIAEIAIGRPACFSRFSVLPIPTKPVREAVERLSDELTAIRNGEPGRDE